MDPQKTLLAVVLSIIVLLLFQSWYSRENTAPTVAGARSTAPAPTPAAVSQPAAAPAQTPAVNPAVSTSGGRIQVATDVYTLQIDKSGGDIRRLALNKYAQQEGSSAPEQLLGRNFNQLWVEQSGLVPMGATSVTPIQFQSDQSSYRLQPGQNQLQVRLRGHLGDLQVDKVLTFHRGSYLVDQRYEVVNQGAQPWQGQAYDQFLRDGLVQHSFFVSVFTGAVLYQNGNFVKETFANLDKKPILFQTGNAWAGIMDHYFLAAVLPPQNQNTQIYARPAGNGYYVSGVAQAFPVIAPGQRAVLTQQLFIGPKEQDLLTSLDRGLIRAVDYGWLTVIAQPLFRLLAWFHGLTGNWGLAIILLTLVVKTIFFPLSAASYKSMANMRKLQPKINKLRERYQDDRQKMGEAMMELYRTEKINPLAGCLPIVVQIPVFIALYWVLLESIELRQAPFFLWIQDLAVKDPYFVLPVLMGISMIVQQRLNPPPMDPIQQKVMYILPVVFTVFFAFFPAGLVLYWLVNNLISVTQQWYILRKVEKAG